MTQHATCRVFDREPPGLVAWDHDLCRAVVAGAGANVRYDVRAVTLLICRSNPFGVVVW